MLTRRQFGLGLLAIGALGFRTAGYDYTSRETFDLFDRVFHDSGASGQPTHTNELGALGWGQSYVLAAFVRMYEAYRDTHYLDRLIHNADLVLAGRDSERGVTDYRGLSVPGWRNTSYTAGGVTLLDVSGRPALEVRSALTNVSDALATVSAGSAEGRFTLVVDNPRKKRVSTFTDLTMDPASPDFAVPRILAAYPTPNMVTAKALSTGSPAPGTFKLAAAPAHFSVHTGMITYPLASFVRLVRHSRHLPRKYHQKAAEYLQAVRDAAAIHEHEWRDAGYFVWTKGMPVPYDGVEQPHNQTLGLGQTYAELAEATGERLYRRRTRALAATFAGDLRLNDRDAYFWPYWPTFGVMYRGYTQADGISEWTPSFGRPPVGAQQAEDLSHAGIDVEFAAVTHRWGMGFTGQDMARFARSYTRNMATTDAAGLATTFLNVDGSGGLAPAGQYLQAPRFMPVAEWDGELFTHAHKVYTDHAVEAQMGSTLLGVAYLNWHARKAD
ncbi:hypothetical protein FHU36_000246 [Nonomuraea muscovyensis]|uniref:Uncharacterized protein n=1 Tax=Nonomuraea muscovyensis TaxID=1124761 RepID=A0A7X0BVM6_9ACTN|nr:hypothetical protein [Nonomuraea muscovyensis]MBB6343737.1 hypothetical protein [Nonomuraea muscovyensis]